MSEPVSPTPPAGDAFPTPPARDPDPVVMYFVVRRSLKLPSGKVGAQIGHAMQYLCQEVLPEGWPTPEETELRRKSVRGELSEEEARRYEAMETAHSARIARHIVAGDWLKSDDHTKIVLGATDDDFVRVQMENDNFFLVRDKGYTEVAPNTETVIGLWPCKKSEASETVKKLKPLRDVDAREGAKVSWRELFKAVNRANSALMDAAPLDPEHQVECHADTLPKVFLKLARGAERAVEHLQVVIQKQMGV